jgi:hypothetical protein
MREQWKDIKDYEGIYQISNKGRVRSLNRPVKGPHGCFIKKKGKILCTQASPFGVEIIGLRNDCHQKTFRVHKLVSEAFTKEERV